MTGLKAVRTARKRPALSASELTEQLKRLWDHYSIPEVHRQLYLKRYCSGKYQSDVLLKEVQSLVRGRALVQRLMNAIEAREEVLLRLSVLRSAFADLELRTPGSLGRCQLSEQLYCLRMSTAEAIKLLHAWRVSVAPVASAGCVAGPGSRGACWPYEVVEGHDHWEDYLLYVMKNDSVVRQFEAVVELAREPDPLLLYGAVGGRGPFESGKLCPPCGDLQRQKLEQAQLLLVEEELSLMLFAENSPRSTPDARPPSRPSSRLVEELAAPLELSQAPDSPVPPRPPSRPRTAPRRPRGSTDRSARPKTSEAQKQAAELKAKQRVSASARKKKRPPLPMWKSQPKVERSEQKKDEFKDFELTGDEVEDMQKELRDMITAFQATRKKSLTDFQGVPKLVKGQTAEKEAERPKLQDMKGRRKSGTGMDLQLARKKSVPAVELQLVKAPTASFDLNFFSEELFSIEDPAHVEEEDECVLKCGMEMARFQSVWNRFENDNAIHHDVACNALARIGFVGPEKQWVEEIFRQPGRVHAHRGPLR
ncbi:unnamed protein product [Durusdinium trenchii]|uniref:Uncharacterized protein n=1 Tax=Durusdinium trenchii TaxID=1381693 RepID=A0ABP0JEH2_9DINO